MQKGKVYCADCGADFSKQTAGVCPKCGSPKALISLYWKRQGEDEAKRYRFRHDVLRGGVPLYYLTAVDQLAAMNRDIAAGKFEPADWTPGVISANRVSALAGRWIDDCYARMDKKELAYGSIHMWQSHMKTHIVPHLGAKDVSIINTIDELIKFKKILPKHLSLKTRREILRTLHNFLGWCALEARVINHVSKFPVIKGSDAKPKKSLTPAQRLQALLRIPATHRDFFEFEMRTGLRPGEACALQVGDINVELGAIRVQRTFSMRKLNERDKEGHKALIPLTSRVIEIVQKHMAGKQPTDWLFTNPAEQAKGRHYTVHNTERYWKTWSGTDVTHYEGTRHSFGTKVSEMFGIRSAQRMLRQADLSSTQKYVHEAIGHMRQQMEQYDETLPVPADGLRTVETATTSQELQEVNGGRGWESNSLFMLILLRILELSDGGRTE